MKTYILYVCTEGYEKYRVLRKLRGKDHIPAADRTRIHID
jgi:hypothetical protein